VKEVEDENALKHMFDKAHLKRTADALVAAYPAFDRKRYLASFASLASLPMKARVRYLRNELRGLLPSNYAKALSILLTVTLRLKRNGIEPPTKGIRCGQVILKW
jgi:hypothetical protein